MSMIQTYNGSIPHTWILRTWTNFLPIRHVVGIRYAEIFLWDSDRDWLSSRQFERRTVNDLMSAAIEKTNTHSSLCFRYYYSSLFLWANYTPINKSEPLFDVCDGMVLQENVVQNGWGDCFTANTCLDWVFTMVSHSISAIYIHAQLWRNNSGKHFEIVRKDLRLESNSIRLWD